MSISACLTHFFILLPLIPLPAPTLLVYLFFSHSLPLSLSLLFLVPSASSFLHILILIHIHIHIHTLLCLKKIHFVLAGIFSFQKGILFPLLYPSASLLFLNVCVVQRVRNTLCICVCVGRNKNWSSLLYSLSFGVWICVEWVILELLIPLLLPLPPPPPPRLLLLLLVNLIQTTKASSTRQRLVTKSTMEGYYCTICTWTYISAITTPITSI